MNLANLNWFQFAVALGNLGAAVVELSRGHHTMAIVYVCWFVASFVLSL